MSLNIEILSKAANQARGLCMDAVQASQSGHLGLPLGCAEIGAVLFGYALKYNPDQPRWINRDIFVLSGGHGSMFLYAWLHMSGYDLPMSEIKRFRQLHSKTPGNEWKHTASMFKKSMATTCDSFSMHLTWRSGAITGNRSSSLRTRSSAKASPKLKAHTRRMAKPALNSSMRPAKRSDYRRNIISCRKTCMTILPGTKRSCSPTTIAGKKLTARGAINIPTRRSSSVTGLNEKFPPIC